MMVDETSSFYINVLPVTSFVGSNSVGIKGAPPGGMAVGESMMELGKAGGLPIAAAV